MARKLRDPYEQQEYQRHNPHLFTTLSQCVNADGSLTTFDGVTRKIQEVLEKLQEYHRREFTGPHPHYCMKGMEKDVCKLIDYHLGELDKVRATFVRNYQYVHDRYRPRATKG